MRLPRRWRRRRVPAAAAGLHGFPPDGESCPPWPVRLAGQQLAIGIQLATINGKRPEREWLIGSADRAELNEAMRELAIAWCWAVMRAGQREAIRPVLERDAMQKAAMPGSTDHD